jgi:hypothetical protein
MMVNRDNRGGLTRLPGSSFVQSRTWSALTLVADPSHCEQLSKRMLFTTPPPRQPGHANEGGTEEN